MADIEFLLGVAFKAQSVRGTATAMPAIGSGSGTGGAINESDGAVMGSDGTGVGDSGIAFSLGKTISEKSVITGSFTRNFANFLGRTVESFQIVTPLKGSGITGSNPLVIADFVLAAGIGVLHNAAGLDATGLASGQLYTPESTTLATAAIYFGNESSNGGQIILRDVEVQTMTVNFPPGEEATVTWDMVAEFDSYNETGSWPAAPFEYGNQATLSAPVVQGVAFTWGPDTPAAREIGFSSFSVAVENEFETVASSNAANGESKRQIGRRVVASGTIDATDGEFLYEIDQLAEDDIANAEALSFQVGTSASIGVAVNSINVSIPDGELTKLEPERLGNSQAWTIELVARASSADTECSLFYN